MQVKLRMVVFLRNSREEEPETTEIASLPELIFNAQNIL